MPEYFLVCFLTWVVSGVPHTQVVTLPRLGGEYQVPRLASMEPGPYPCQGAALILQP